jgi:hypothetical protein
MKKKKLTQSGSVMSGPPCSTRPDGREWTGVDDQLLKKLLKANTPIQMIGLKLGLKLGRSLGPVHYRPKRDRLTLKSLPRE